MQKPKNIPIEANLHKRVKVAASKKGMGIREYAEIALVRLLRSKQ